MNATSPRGTGTTEDVLHESVRIPSAHSFEIVEGKPQAVRFGGSSDAKGFRGIAHNILKPQTVKYFAYHKVEHLWSNRTPAGINKQRER